MDHIEVSPILIKKGINKLAIYGISSQRDDRLCRAFMRMLNIKNILNKKSKNYFLKYLKQYFRRICEICTS